MQALHAGVEKVAALLSGVVDAELAHGFVVVAKFIKLGDEPGRKIGSAEFSECFDYNGVVFLSSAEFSG